MSNNFPLKVVDSHCHLDRLNIPLETVLEEAQACGVHYMLCVCVVLDAFPAMLKLVEPFSFISVSVGLHPDESTQSEEPSVETLYELARQEKCVAIGETGLDYYRQSEPEVLKNQQQRFRNHIQAAHWVKKPLIVHTRSAAEDTIRILREEKAQEVGGVMHCFTETWEVAEQAMALNFYISFSGIVTFKNAESLQEVVKKMPLERLLIETDSPYLAPVPYRGKANQPAYVVHVAHKIAELKKITYEEVICATTQNYFNLFSTAKR